MYSNLLSPRRSSRMHHMFKFFETTSVVAVCSVHMYSLSTPFQMVILPRVHIIGVFLSFKIFIQNYVIFSQKIRKISQLIEFMLEKNNPLFCHNFFNKNPPQKNYCYQFWLKIFKFSNSNWVFSDEKKNYLPHSPEPTKKTTLGKTLSLYLGFRIRISECFILQKMLPAIIEW